MLFILAKLFVLGIENIPTPLFCLDNPIPPAPDYPLLKSLPEPIEVIFKLLRPIGFEAPPRVLYLMRWAIVLGVLIPWSLSSIGSKDSIWEALPPIKSTGFPILEGSTDPGRPLIKFSSPRKFSPN